MFGSSASLTFSCKFLIGRLVEKLFDCMAGYRGGKFTALSNKYFSLIEKVHCLNEGLMERQTEEMRIRRIKQATSMDKSEDRFVISRAAH